MKSRDIAIDVARGIAILLVVCGHVIQQSMAPFRADFFLNPVFKLIYTFHLPLFFFLSGYSMFLSLTRRSVAGALKARAKSLLVPFLTWGILGIFTGYALDMMGGKKGICLFQDFTPQLLLNPMIWVWFLFTLFVASVVLLCSIQLGKKLGPAIFPISCLLLWLIPYNEEFNFYYVKWFYLFYAAGYCVKRYDLRIKNPVIRSWVEGLAVFLFVLLLPYWEKIDFIYIHKMQFLSGSHANDLLRFGYRYFMGFLGIAIVLYIARSLSRNKIGAGLAAIGVYSLDIYLIQRYIVEGIYPRLVAQGNLSVGFNSGFFLLIYVPLVTGLFVFICMLFAKFLFGRNKFLRGLLFGRF